MLRLVAILGERNETLIDRTPRQRRLYVLLLEDRVLARGNIRLNITQPSYLVSTNVFGFT